MKIPIETGRWENIPKEKRLCKFVMKVLMMSFIIYSLTKVLI
jgi:hypothetical protein